MEDNKEEIEHDIEETTIEKPKKQRKPRTEAQKEVWNRCLAQRQSNNLKRRELKEKQKNEIKEKKKVIKEKVSKELDEMLKPEETINTSESSSSDSEFEYVIRRNKRDYLISRNRRGQSHQKTKTPAKAKPQPQIKPEPQSPPNIPTSYYDPFE